MQLVVASTRANAFELKAFGVVANFFQGNTVTPTAEHDQTERKERWDKAGGEKEGKGKEAPTLSQELQVDVSVQKSNDKKVDTKGP